MRFAMEGAHVVMCSRDRDRIEAAAADVADAARNPDSVMGVVADVTRSEDIETLVDRAMERFGGIDILVANAGGPPAGSFETLSPEPKVP